MLADPVEVVRSDAKMQSYSEKMPPPDNPKSKFRRGVVKIVVTRRAKRGSSGNRYA